MTDADQKETIDELLELLACVKSSIEGYAELQTQVKWIEQAIAKAEGK